MGVGALGREDLAEAQERLQERRKGKKGRETNRKEKKKKNIDSRCPNMGAQPRQGPTCQRGM